MELLYAQRRRREPWNDGRGMMELLYVLGSPKPKPKPRPAERRGAAVVLLSVSGLGGGCDVANIDFPHCQQTLLPRGAMFPPARVSSDAGGVR